VRTQQLTGILISFIITGMLKPRPKNQAGIIMCNFFTHLESLRMSNYNWHETFPLLSQPHSFRLSKPCNGNGRLPCLQRVCYQIDNASFDRPMEILTRHYTKVTVYFHEPRTKVRLTFNLSHGVTPSTDDTTHEVTPSTDDTTHGWHHVYDDQIDDRPSFEGRRWILRRKNWNIHQRAYAISTWCGNIGIQARFSWQNAEVNVRRAQIKILAV
jgi:hypothetical protein